MPRSKITRSREDLLKQEVLTPKETAVVLDCSEDRVRLLMKIGRLKYTELGPRMRRISMDNIRAFLNAKNEGV